MMISLQTILSQRTKQLIAFLGFVLFGFVLFGFILSACSNTNSVAPEEFVVQSQNIQGYTQWLRVAEVSGTGNFPLLLGRAHYSSSPWVTRRVYANTTAQQGRGASGEFPNGSIIVKTFHDNTGKWLLGEVMVKRQQSGGTFNTDHQGWEWLEIRENGTITLDTLGREQRGAQFYNGLCNSCHAQYRSRDYLFTY
jgi:hypothetical protein